MSDAGYILASYIATIVSIVGLVVVTIRRGRGLARQVSDKDKPWI